MIARWVRFCDRREPAHVLALVRIGVALVIACDLLQAARVGAVPLLWAPIEDGGIGPVTRAHPLGELYELIGASLTSAWCLWSVALISASCLLLGLFTRSSALLLLLAYAQLARIVEDGDRGIDQLLRNVLLILACSRAGATLSLDARLFHGRWLRSEEQPAWPRYLIIAQLTLMYFWAGLLKQSASWTSIDGYSALYLVLNQPHYASFTLAPALLARAYPLLQLSAITTLLFERGAIVVPWLLWLRATRERGGWLRAVVHGAHLLPLWVAIGVVFHLGLAVLLDLGIFPWGCLVLYPALASPHTVRGWLERARHAIVGLSPTALRSRTSAST